MATMTDDEQKEQMKSFAKRYGSPIVTGVLLAVSAVLGWQWWDKKQEVTATNMTVQYQNLTTQAASTLDDAGYKKLVADAEKNVSENPNSAQALQTQLLIAGIAFDRADFETASKVLTQASTSKLDDAGLKAIASLRLAYTKIEQNKLDDALKTLDGIKVKEFSPSVQEARGDIFVAKNDLESAKKAYQAAWDALAERKQPRDLLQMKLANLGVLVEDMVIENPILTAMPTAPSEQ